MNCRELAVSILNRVLNEDAYSTIVLSEELNKSDLNQKDKALVTEIVNGVLRTKKTLDITILNFVKDIKNMDPTVLNILRVSVYQMNFLDKIPSYAACNEATEMAKSVSEEAAKLVNGVLRNFVRNLENGEDIKVEGNKIDEYAYKFSFEPWMIRLLIKQYDENTAKKIMSGLNNIPEVTLRVNALKADYDEVYDELEAKEYEVAEGVICPEAVCIAGGGNIAENPLFQEGKVTVQDESAMLVAPLLDLEDGMTVFDLCSAPGGKTTHIAEILNNTGEVRAFDIYQNKLALIEDNCRRLGITNVKTEESDASVLRADLVASADRVLADVPCSGIGVIRKRPEIKWRKKRKDLRELVPVQRKIMENAWGYLKKGGVMIYSTCTLNKEENEENVNWFAEKHPDCEIERIFVGKQKNLMYNIKGYLTIMPNESMDGFFIAKLIKK